MSSDDDSFVKTLNFQRNPNETIFAYLRNTAKKKVCNFQDKNLYDSLIKFDILNATPDESAEWSDLILFFAKQNSDLQRNYFNGLCELYFQVYQQSSQVPLVCGNKKFTSTQKLFHYVNDVIYRSNPDDAISLDSEDGLVLVDLIRNIPSSLMNIVNIVELKTIKFNIFNDIRSLKRLSLLYVDKDGIVKDIIVNLFVLFYHTQPSQVQNAKSVLSTLFAEFLLSALHVKKESMLQEIRSLAPTVEFLYRDNTRVFAIRTLLLIQSYIELVTSIIEKLIQHKHFNKQSDAYFICYSLLTVLIDFFHKIELTYDRDILLKHLSNKQACLDYYDEWKEYQTDTLKTFLTQNSNKITAQQIKSLTSSMISDILMREKYLKLDTESYVDSFVKMFDNNFYVLAFQFNRLCKLAETISVSGNTVSIFAEAAVDSRIITTVKTTATNTIRSDDSEIGYFSDTNGDQSSDLDDKCHLSSSDLHLSMTDFSGDDFNITNEVTVNAKESIILSDVFISSMFCLVLDKYVTTTCSSILYGVLLFSLNSNIDRYWEICKKQLLLHNEKNVSSHLKRKSIDFFSQLSAGLVKLTYSQRCNLIELLIREVECLTDELNSVNEISVDSNNESIMSLQYFLIDIVIMLASIRREDIFKCSDYIKKLYLACYKIDTAVLKLVFVENAPLSFLKFFAFLLSLKELKEYFCFVVNHINEVLTYDSCIRTWNDSIFDDPKTILFSELIKRSDVYSDWRTNDNLQKITDITLEFPDILTKVNQTKRQEPDNYHDNAQDETCYDEQLLCKNDATKIQDDISACVFTDDDVSVDTADDIQRNIASSVENLNQIVMQHSQSNHAFTSDKSSSLQSSILHHFDSVAPTENSMDNLFEPAHDNVNGFFKSVNPATLSESESLMFEFPKPKPRSAFTIANIQKFAKQKKSFSLHTTSVNTSDSYTDGDTFKQRSSFEEIASSPVGSKNNDDLFTSYNEFSTPPRSATIIRILSPNQVLSTSPVASMNHDCVEVSTELSCSPIASGECFVDSNLTDVVAHTPSTVLLSPCSPSDLASDVPRTPNRQARKLEFLQELSNNRSLKSNDFSVSQFYERDDMKQRLCSQLLALVDLASSLNSKLLTIDSLHKSEISLDVCKINEAIKRINSCYFAYDNFTTFDSLMCSSQNFSNHDYDDSNDDVPTPIVICPVEPVVISPTQLLSHNVKLNKSKKSKKRHKNCLLSSSPIDTGSSVGKTKRERRSSKHEGFKKVKKFKLNDASISD